MRNLDLRKTKAETVVDNFDDDFLLDGEDKPSFLSQIQVDPKDVVGFLIRLVLLAVGSLTLMYLEKENLNKLNGQKVIINEELSSLKKEQEALKTKVDSFGVIKKQAEEFNNKLAVLQVIAENRMSAVQGLDVIQSSIPKEVWIKRVDFNDRKFKITGNSTTTKKVHDFVDTLKSEGHFSEVDIKRDDKDNSSKRFIRRSFEITSILKNNTSKGG